MLLVLYLLAIPPLLPISFANPVPGPDPHPRPNPEPFAIPLHTSPHPSPRGHDVSLSHTPGHVRRARQALHARHGKRDQRDLLERQSDRTWLLEEAAKVDTRYNAGAGRVGAAPEHSKRANGDVSDHNLDASYSGSLSIGTPAQNFDIVLDTGSSDLWIAGAGCAIGCNAMAQYDGSQSSTNVKANGTFNISYGSGQASGTLAQDSVTLGGYTVASQTFASCDSITPNLITSTVSGIMGLSWQSLAYSGATPWWLTLAKSNTWSDPLFGFHLKRYRDVAGAQSAEADGGKATFGYLDTSLYTGDITYVSVPTDAQYWQIPMDSMTVQGTTVNLGSSNVVAVDTGTTLIGGPSDSIAQIYAAIPNSKQMTGSYANYYEYPCTTDIDLQLTFGGFTTHITNADFNLGRYSQDESMCTGAVFVQTLPSNAPVQWIVGDTALKNVYSVYRYSPAAVGFANLASSAQQTTGSTTIPDISTSTDTSGSATADASLSVSSSGASSQGSPTSANGQPIVTVISSDSSATPTMTAISAAVSSGAASRQLVVSGGWTLAGGTFLSVVLGLW